MWKSVGDGFTGKGKSEVWVGCSCWLTWVTARLFVPVSLILYRGEADTESLIRSLVVLDWLGEGVEGVGDDGMRCKVLVRAGWKHIFCIPGFENISPG